MKGSCTLVASVLALAVSSSTSTSTSSSTSYAARPHLTPSGLDYSKLRSDKSRNLPLTTSDKDKFAPRFDGLRFIETLVTAHR